MTPLVFILIFFNILVCIELRKIGTLNSRIILSPGHFKRMISAMNENLKKYEDQFGTIAESEAPKQNIGFQA